MRILGPSMHTFDSDIVEYIAEALAFLGAVWILMKAAMLLDRPQKFTRPRKPK